MNICLQEVMENEEVCLFPGALHNTWNLEMSRQMKGLDNVEETNTYRAFLPFDTPIGKNWYLPWAGLEPTSPWLLVGHAKPLHHQGYHAGNAAD